jgi:shikimate kinase
MGSSPASREPRHLVLVGMMGAGKSSVGAAVAARLGRPFLDTDEMVEATSGRSVRAIFAAEGEAAFRDREAEALASALASPEPAVIAAGGGAVLRDDNRARLRSAVVVWLRATPATLSVRTAGAGHRPLLDADPAGTLARLAEERRPLYEEVADAVVDVDGLAPDAVADAVLRCAGAAAGAAGGGR